MSDKILVTGFGPFGEHVVNASWKAVQLLPDEIDGINIIKEEIPVQYSQVEQKVPDLWRQHQPLLVIHVGVSQEAKVITIEQCAKRYGYDRCDVLGQKHPTGEACVSGQNCIFTGINVMDLCDKINKGGYVNACASTDAGRYLCEYIYYTSLNIDPSKVLFVHVPTLDNPYSAGELAQGLLNIIQFTLDQLFGNYQ
ncbi:unnamed protein product [Phyllotreta striolata]|uniref:Pyroglutamyl-peptidase 1 n=1 Tax=Phyllotreta striolata TaxID=444603 RepID=A0A9N9T9G3_PHYSR|nr:unnamed protein product [Phyllotreta striolata]